MSERTLDFIIRNAQRNVAAEGISVTVAKDMFSSVFTNNVFGAMKQRVGRAFAPAVFSGFKMRNNITPKVVDWANRESYLNIGDVTVFAPVGLKVSFMEYITALEKALTYLVDLDAELLKPTQQALSTLLNSPEQLSAASGIVIKGKMINLGIEVATSDITKSFNPDEKSDKIKYKQAFNRNADLTAVGERLLNIQDNISKVNTAAVRARVDALFAVAESLADAIESDDNYKNVSKKVNMQITQALYNCAQWVEFYAIFQHKLIVLSSAIYDTEEKLKRLSK